MNILAASYSFPPDASPRASQVSRVLAELPADVAVVCADNLEGTPDPTVAPGIDERLAEIIRIPHGRPLLSRRLDYAGYRLKISWAHAPDPQRPWADKARDLILNRLSLGTLKPDILITFGAPMSGHLIGPPVKKTARVPWIAHFSDPWADNPYRRDNPATAFINRRLERLVVELADAVVFTSPETIDLVMKKYPKELRRKASYIPHCFDPSAYPPGEPPEGEYVVRMLGGLYTLRTPEPFYKAVERAAASDPGALSGVRFEFYGYIETRLKNLIDKYPAAKRAISFHGNVAYSESLRLMKTAHCLLAIDAPARFSVFFPSKIVDYLGSGRHIFAVTPPGACARVTRELGGTVADPSDDEAVFRALLGILRGRPASSRPPSDSTYDCSHVAAETMSLISSVATGNKHLY
jgi:hypothetical protein